MVFAILFWAPNIPSCPRQENPTGNEIDFKCIETAMEPKPTSTVRLTEDQVHTLAPNSRAAEPNDKTGGYASEGASHFLQEVENDVPNAGVAVARIPSADPQPAMPKPSLANPPEQTAVCRETEVSFTFLIVCTIIAQYCVRR